MNTFVSVTHDDTGALERAVGYDLCTVGEGHMNRVCGLLKLYEDDEVCDEDPNNLWKRNRKINYRSLKITITVHFDLYL